MNDYEFALEIRRALLMVAWALYKRFGNIWLRVILTGNPCPPLGQKEE